MTDRRQPSAGGGDPDGSAGGAGVLPRGIDRRLDDDVDHAWLLARERGEPQRAISDARARGYARLGALVADLPPVPAGTVQRSGWEQAVLAAIDAGHDAASPTAVTETPRAEESTAPAPARSRRRRVTATAAAAALAMAAGVAIAVFLRGDRRPDVRVGTDIPVVTPLPDRSSPPTSVSPPPPTPIPASPPTRVAEVTRGIHVEPGRLGFDHAVQVRRSDTAASRELRDGDTVVTGDRIHASITTSVDAYLYLAFCADQRLQLYPSPRGVRTTAGALVLVPEAGGELVVDSHPGSEVLYLIVTRDELSRADPRLAALLAAT
ncbi:MAG: DUF4384 domain-containing protein, partial [Deltaproteobacteria bacterium]